MNCALSDLSASELNAAIDDTNFPKNNNVENGKKTENGDGGANGSVIRTLKNGSFKRDVPSPLVGAAFSDNYADMPSTPKTPRTTTTPGKLSIALVKRKSSFSQMNLNFCEEQVIILTILIYLIDGWLTQQIFFKYKNKT